LIGLDSFGGVANNALNLRLKLGLNKLGLKLGLGVNIELRASGIWAALALWAAHTVGFDHVVAEFVPLALNGAVVAK
jgi:hypothetical protein